MGSGREDDKLASEGGASFVNAFPPRRSVNFHKIYETAKRRGPIESAGRN